MSNEEELNCVLLHGWGVNKSIWNGIVDRLRGFNHVEAVCLYAIAEDAKAGDVDALASYLKEKIKDNTVIIAWSFGGLVATRLASLCDNIKAIVYIASSPCFINKADWNNVLDKKSILDLQRDLLRDPEKTIEYFAGLIAHGDKNVKNLIATIRSSLADEIYSPTLSSWLNELLEQDQRKEFAALDMPIQYVFAEHDALISPDIIEQLKQAHPKIECVIINDSGHAPFIAKPQEIINLIDGFISAQLR